MNVYKLKILINEDNNSDLENKEYMDIWLDVEEVYGFLIPVDPETRESQTELINLFHHGEIETVKQEDHIVAYLKEHFVDKAIKSNE